MQEIDTADHVHHAPSGETWVVAYVKGDRLAWCGWPQGLANLADCALVKKATEAERDKLLHDMASINESDTRATYARQRLADMAMAPNRAVQSAVDEMLGRGAAQPNA